MSRLRGWIVRLGATLGIGRGRRDIEAELESALQLHIDDLIRSGLSPDEARRTARLRQGSLMGVHEAYRDQEGIPVLRIAADAFRHGLRGLVRHPGFAAVVVAILAVGVGTTAALVGVVDTLMFRPPAHVRAMDALVRVASAGSYPQYDALARASSTVDVTTYARRMLSLGHGESARAIETHCVTASYFPVLGAVPVAGRVFAAADDARGAAPTMVIGHHVWRREFGGDASIIGRSVTVGATPHTVIGVAPPEFRGLDMAAVDAWILLQAAPAMCSLTGVDNLDSTGGSWLTTVARMREGVTLAQAEAEVRGLALHQMRSDSRDAPVRELVPAIESRAIAASGDRRLAIWLAAGAGLVLLIACANVAGLLSVRAIERRQEVAVRLQLGASRGRVFAQLVAENLALAIAAGVAAWVVSGWTSGMLRAFFPSVAHSAWFDPRTTGVLVLFMVIAAGLSGVVPALQTARAGGVALWRSGRAVADARSRMRSSLLVLQVALALMLVIGAGLFARSVLHAKSGLGYDLDRVVVATVDFDRAGIRRQAEQHRVLDEVLTNIRRLPNVEAVALSTSSPLGSGQSYTLMPGGTSGPGSGSAPLMTPAVTPEYFRVLGTRIVEGRPFMDHDAAAGPPVAIVDVAVARERWPGERVVGRCMEIAPGSPCTTILGLSESRRIGSLRSTSREVFFPLKDGSSRAPQAILVRPTGQVREAVPSIAAAIRAAAPNLPYINVRPLEDLADVQARSWRLGARLFGLFGGLAVALSAVGLYASLAFAVRQRTSEIGVRMALGADAGAISRLVLGHGVRLVVAGWLLGLGPSALLVGSVASLLYGVAPLDPATFAIASALVVVAALGGCFVPAFRASRVDPVVALRTE